MTARMDIATLRLLEQIDAQSSVHAEYPDDLDWAREIAQVRALAPVVEQIIGRACTVDDGVQDASFLADIAAYERSLERDIGLVAALAVRFSNFGRLFTTWSTAPTPLDPGVVAAVIHAVRERSYLYVDGTMLNVPYTGVDPRYKGGTWWIRFFEYL
jgi:hypothetical protein